jgi:hypothetical protein
MTSEFQHYPGCRHKDPANCSGCALTTGGPNGPNYSGWPLVYMENGRTIPAKWREAFERELNRADNMAYARNVRDTLARLGGRFSDGTKL